jgi:hypothetical protein
LLCDNGTVARPGGACLRPGCALLCACLLCSAGETCTLQLGPSVRRLA